MIRLNVVLFIALVLSGLYLVNVSYEVRSQFVQLERANAEERALEKQFEQLQLEQRSQATPSRVEKLAREKLQMRAATPAVTYFVTYTGSAVSPAAGQGGQP